MEVIVEVILRKRIEDEEVMHPDVIREQEREVVVQALNPLLQEGWEIVIPMTRIAK